MPFWRPAEGNETGGRIAPDAQEKNLLCRCDGEFSSPGGDAAPGLNYAWPYGERERPEAGISMAPTNRLIEARRAELRAEADTQKPRATKTASAKAGAKTGRPKARPKAK